jgi:hypothetical protein
LRVWRTDESPRSAQPNVPGRGQLSPAAGGGEYLVIFVIDVPGTTSPEDLDQMIAREARQYVAQPRDRQGRRAG